MNDTNELMVADYALKLLQKCRDDVLCGKWEDAARKIVEIESAIAGIEQTEDTLPYIVAIDAGIRDLLGSVSRTQAAVSEAIDKIDLYISALKQAGKEDE